MMPIAHRFRFPTSLVFLAAIIAAPFFARRDTIVVVAMPSIVETRVVTALQPWWCRGYDARASSIDLRAWCYRD